jgi:hypothetical protein
VSVTLLFVHSPLVGPLTWSRTTKVLCNKGFHCQAPSLTGTVMAGPPFYAPLAEAAAAAVRGTDEAVVLIGHSGAGALLPAIADILGHRTHAAVFVDALLPHPALSWFDTAPPQLGEQLRGLAVSGRLPPWHEWFPPGAIEELLPDPALRREFTAEIPRLPVAYFEEPAPIAAAAFRGAYLRFSAAYDRAADEADQLGWWVVRKDWDHLRMLTAPEPVAEVIAQAISAVSAG